MGLEIFDGVNCVIHVAAETGFSKFASAKKLEEVNVNGNLIINFIFTFIILKKHPVIQELGM